MTLAAQIPDNIKRVSRSLGYALWLDSFNDWFTFSAILQARLDTRQRAALAFMALKTLDADTAAQTVDAALNSGAGMPMVPLASHMDQAAWWADRAEPDELDAYVLASFNAMHPARQADFLAYVPRRADP
jgi:hypothetical protein